MKIWIVKSQGHVPQSEQVIFCVRAKTARGAKWLAQDLLIDSGHAYWCPVYVQRHG